MCAAGAHRFDVEIRPFVDAEGGAGEREEAGCEPRRERTGRPEVAVQLAAIVELAGDDDVEAGALERRF